MALAPSDTLGRYEIVEPLGRGAMGSVYLARDPLIGRLVALKTIPVDPHSGTPGEGGLLSEARSAGVLSHPNIVSVHDVLDLPDEGMLCIAMEYVEGTDLQTILRRPQAVSLELAMDVVSQVAAALDYAHQRGVVHRDVKPANIIVADDGTAKIADFGISHLKSSAISAELRYMGTPHYLAPERIRGDAADQRADVFSLGVVLYELLARRHPFSGETVAALTRAIAEDEPAPLSALVPGISPDLVAVVEKALQKDPEQRYRTAGELAADLRRVVSGQESLSETQPTIPVQPRPRSSMPRFLALGGAALVLVAIGIGGALLTARRPPEAIAVEPPVAPSEIRSVAPLVEEARRLLDRGDPSAARILLERATERLPTSRTVAHLYELAGRQVAMDRAAELEMDIQELLTDGRNALRRGRLRDASRAASAALALDPLHEGAEELWTDLSRARARLAAAAEEEADPPPTFDPVPELRPVEPPSDPEPAEPANGSLRVVFSSDVPRGVLTVYAGERQVLLRPFRFQSRRGVLLRRGGGGSFRETIELPRGPTRLVVYLTLPNEKAQVARLDFDLRGGTQRDLVVSVDESGVLATNLP